MAEFDQQLQEHGKMDTKPLRKDPDDHQSYVLTCTE